MTKPKGKETVKENPIVKVKQPTTIMSIVRQESSDGSQIVSFTVNKKEIGAYRDMINSVLPEPPELDFSPQIYPSPSIEPKIIIVATLGFILFVSMLRIINNR